MTHRRKLQLVAGSTYLISLPKTWVKNRGLNSGDELLITEKDDMHLLISPTSVETAELTSLNISYEKFESIIENILFSSYYLGLDNINITSKDGIPKKGKRKIKNALTFMSGTEINHEDDKTIEVRVFLDKSKVDVIQLLYRMSLVIGQNITEMMNENAMEEIVLNEQEIDRMHHLMNRITSLAIRDSTEILKSSNINYVSFIPSLLRISKLLERLGDDITQFSKILESKEVVIKNDKHLNFFKAEIEKSVRALNKKSVEGFKKADENNIKEFNAWVKGIKSDYARDILYLMRGHMISLQEVVVNLLFYKGLVENQILI